MKLKFSCLNDYLEINECGVYQIIIENPKYLFNVINELYMDIGNHDYLTLYNDNYLIIENSQYDYFHNVLSLEFNSRKNMTSLTKLLNKELINSYLTNTLKNINDMIYLELNKFALDFYIPIEFNNEVEAIDFLKTFNVHIKENYINLIDKIVKYINVTTFLRKTRIYITYNLTDFLSKDEINDLNTQLQYDQVLLINISNHIYDENRLKSRDFIIDKSLCLLK